MIVTCQRVRASKRDSREILYYSLQLHMGFAQLLSSPHSTDHPQEVIVIRSFIQKVQAHQTSIGPRTQFVVDRADQGSGRGGRCSE